MKIYPCVREKRGRDYSRWYKFASTTRNIWNEPAYRTSFKDFELLTEVITGTFFTGTPWTVKIVWYRNTQWMKAEALSSEGSNLTTDTSTVYRFACRYDCRAGNLRVSERHYLFSFAPQLHFQELLQLARVGQVPDAFKSN